MLSKLVVLIASLAILNVSFGTNLRSEAVAAELDTLNVPELDHATVERFKKHFSKSLSARGDADHKKTTAALKAIHADVVKDIKKNKDAKFQPTAAMRVQNAMDPEIRWGSFVTRHRPNSDCSGSPSLVFAERMKGECMPDGYGMYYYISCAHENDDGKVTSTYSAFYDMDCQNFAYSSQMNNEMKCQADYGLSSDSTLPGKVGYQCARRYALDYSVEHGGVVSATYDDAGCAGQVSRVIVQRFHGCDMFWDYHDYDGNPVDYPTESPYNTYHFYSLDGCGQGNKASMTIYTDRACTRPLGRGAFHFDNEQCQSNGYGGEYTTMTCMAEPQM